MTERRLPTQAATSALAPVKDLARKSSLELMSQPGLSRMIGLLADNEFPAPVVQTAIRWYIRHYNVDTSEMEHPPEHYKSFDAFFTRKLREGVHVIDESPTVAVSPVDGRVLNFGRISDGRIDQIKGRSYRVDELLDSTKEAARFAKGHYVTIYLSPRDYHRIHCPVSGRITGFRYVAGRLYPVNQLGVQNVDKLFAVNERLISYIESDLGGFAVAKVGATNVGKITASYHEVTTNVGRRTSYDEVFRRKVAINKGDELGQFHMGSTVVLLTERPELRPIDLSENQSLRMGETLFNYQTD
ncbi:MAG TPA: phosphatidylserine decarboxylase [Myxococcales bacterium]|nr:phosphatidylserine decarboxylase [Myxococcales bacterium]